ncbi:MAG: hypothetical protein J6S00_03595 [Clostridia bacterium]|nr:hypothetical protein [Clostridia bacterium]
MYKVIKYFEDLQDNKFPYDVGDAFPREHKTVSNERIKELASNKNRRGEPLIKKVAEPKSDKKTKTNE